MYILRPEGPFNGSGHLLLLLLVLVLVLVLLVLLLLLLPACKRKGRKRIKGDLKRERGLYILVRIAA